MGEDLERASITSSLDRGPAEGSHVRQPHLGRGSLRRKEWSRMALSIATGSEAP